MILNSFGNESMPLNDLVTLTEPVTTVVEVLIAERVKAEGTSIGSSGFSILCLFASAIASIFSLISLALTGLFK